MDRLDNENEFKEYEAAISRRDSCGHDFSGKPECYPCLVSTDGEDDSNGPYHYYHSFITEKDVRAYAMALDMSIITKKNSEVNTFKEFKNFMCNDLKVTKDDIKEIIKEYTETEIKKLMSQTYGNFDFKDIVARTIVNDIINRRSGYNAGNYRSDILKLTAEILANKMELTTKEQ